MSRIVKYEEKLFQLLTDVKNNSVKILFIYAFIRIILFLVKPALRGRGTTFPLLPQISHDVISQIRRKIKARQSFTDPYGIPKKNLISKARKEKVSDI